MSKKKISVDSIDDLADSKGSKIKTLWQVVKFTAVSMVAAVIQYGLALLLPLIFDRINMPELPAFLSQIFNANSVPPDKISIYVSASGIVTWGYVLPFLLSNAMANIYAYIQNKKTTFKSDAPKYCFAIYIVVLVCLILFSTWLQSIIVGALTSIDLANYGGITLGFMKFVSRNGVARVLAAMASGMIQMCVLFPIEKFVLLKEKPKKKTSK